jgi:hypothetical protein
VDCRFMLMSFVKWGQGLAEEDAADARALYPASVSQPQ